MNTWPEGNAVVYCEGAFNTPNGKTAHGLVRHTRRYHVVSVVDSQWSGKDAGEILDGQPAGIPICGTLPEAVDKAGKSENPATHFVVGLAPDGGRLSPNARQDVLEAISLGMHVDSGLHDYLSEDDRIASAAKKMNIRIRDVRKPPPTQNLHFFDGKIADVTAFKIAVLGTDSAVGKRTTAWKIVHGINQIGLRAELVGTGQTAWMQGAAYGLILDSLVNDFVTGEIEHAVWSAWQQARAEVVVIEGQGGIMNPAYPGGYEILAAARPDVIVLQHAPARAEYDGFPGCRMHPLPKQIQLIELLSGKPVVAVTVNHEGISVDQISTVCDMIHKLVGVPAFDVLASGTDNLMDLLIPYFKKPA